MKDDIMMPCPFCGSADVFLDRRSPYPTRKLSVLCPDCGGRGGVCTESGEAIEAWNKRWPKTSPEITATLLEVVQKVVDNAENVLRLKEFEKHIGWEIRTINSPTPLVFKIEGINWKLKLVSTNYGEFAPDLCELTGRRYDENSNNWR